MTPKLILTAAMAVALVGCGAYTPVKEMHPADSLQNDVSWEYEFVGATDSTFLVPSRTERQG